MVPFRRLAFLLLILIVAALFPACRKTDRVTEATREKVLLLGNGAEPKSLDPQLIQSVGDSNISRALFEGLVANHIDRDDVAEPGVAERWDHNEDFSVWTFHLRKNAKWSNGDPVTAQDFVYAYRRILTPELASPYASMLYFLENGEQFNKGETADFSEVGVKALDDHTLRCSLIGSIDYFTEIIKHTTYLPVHRPTIEKFGAMTDRFTLWQRPGNHVGNGAFKLKSWRINHSVVVERNPFYWDADNVALNGIEFVPIPSEYTEERAYRDGQLHLTYVLATNLIDWYKENRPDIVRIDPYAGAYFYRCNVHEPPLDNINVRRALAYAVDRKAIVENVMLGGQLPAHAYCPPFPGIYEPPQVVSFDPEKARAYLAEAGYPNGEGFPGFEILINTLESHRSVAEAIQDMWKRHLNIENIEIRNQEWKVFQSNLHSLKYEVARSGWIGDYVHPTTFLYMWTTGDSNNETGWGNPDYDRLLDEASQTSDLEERRAKFYAAEEILLTEMPVIPIYWYTRPYLLSPDVKNWAPLLLDNHNYKFIRLEAAAVNR